MINPLMIMLTDDETAMVASYAAKMGMSSEQVVRMALKLYDALEITSESRQKDRAAKKCCVTCTCSKSKV